jgi:phospho-N-acetylmuramoyl-pentapeptide-transferase
VIAILLASATSLVLSLVGTRVLMAYFRRIGRGQPILGAEDLGPVQHMAKQGTPTMGGLAILFAGATGWSVAHVRDRLPFSDQSLIIWVAILVLGGIGLLDDVLKVRRQHNRGIFWKRKGWLTFGVCASLAWWLVSATGVARTISFTRADLPGFEVTRPLFVVWIALIVWATANAVNVTDGLDGLAAGSAALGFVAFTVIGYWTFRNPDLYDRVVNPLDLTVLAASLAGACGGFLWWNAAPARIFMGDVGALGLGTALGLLAVSLNTQLLLPLICGLQVFEAGSVAVQMGVFRASGRTRRLLRMSPIHHHFELAGWPETTVIVRFWIISAICVATAVATFIADFTNLSAAR